MGNKAKGLQNKHKRALQLIEAGNLTLPEVAKACNISLDYMYELYYGKSQAGKMGQLFKAEVDKITARNAEKTKDLATENRLLILMKQNEWLKTLKDVPVVDDELLKQLNSTLIAINKASPNVQIGDVTFNNLNIDTQEARLDVFKQLKDTAQHLLDRGGVSGTATERTEEIPQITTDGKGGEGKAEFVEVCSLSEAEEVS